ncbi:MAG: tetraacyldisaccharide 4'-kinase [Bacteroidales bacterium]|jgi:tetraacyldisaccharide 4'-kinase
MKFFKFILFPFSFIYGFTVAVRNILFDLNFFKTHSFNLPIITVGNLSYGGSGKTPTVEYLIRLLTGKINVATLSRGYKRRTKGFVLADSSSLISDIGDEPKQFKSKFSEITVAVCEDRCAGVNQLLKKNKDLGCIILDDAFQHRSIKAGLNILLTDYNNLYTDDYVLPSGSLREFRSGAKRADIIIVTKCPRTLSETGRKVITGNIAPKAHQQVFFSYIDYLPMLPLNNDTEKSVDKFDSILLFSGIANTKPLEEYLHAKKYEVISMHYGDHYKYSNSDLLKIRESFNNFAANHKIILTTEKDKMRIETYEQKEALKDLPVFYIPIMTDFFPSDKEMFNKIIIDYVENAGKNKRND